MSERVRLRRDVAEALNELYEKGRTNKEIIEDFLHEDDVISVQASVIKEHMMFDTFLQVLVNGYEVEQTPEDRIRWAICNAGDLAPLDSDTAYVQGIKCALEVYGIRIKGVNAE